MDINLEVNISSLRLTSSIRDTIVTLNRTRKEKRMVMKKSTDKKTQKKVLVVRVEKEVADRLKAVCQEEGMTMNSLLNTRIINFLKSKSKKPASTN
jgi:regulator of PEP synthase PpsR (kinase-PPPase family)